MTRLLLRDQIVHMTNLVNSEKTCMTLAQTLEYVSVFYHFTIFFLFYTILRVLAYGMPKKFYFTTSRPTWSILPSYFTIHPTS